MKDKQGSSILLIGIVVAIIVVALVGYNVYAPKLQPVTNSLPSFPAAPSTPPTQQTGTQHVQPSPVPQVTNVPAGWKTYKNEKYGFEIKYPAQYSFKDQFTGEFTQWMGWRDSDAQVLFYDPITFGTNDSNNINIQFFQGIKFYQIKKVLSQSYGGWLTQKQVDLGGTEFTQILAKSQILSRPVEDNYYLVLEAKNGVYVVEATNLDSSRMQEVLQAMFATFKFTK